MKMYWAEILTGLFVAFVCAISFGAGFILCFAHLQDDVRFYEAMLYTPEPRICALCSNKTNANIHAPCIVNLATGEVAELAIYDPHPTETYAVEKKGYTSFFAAAGAVIQQNCDSEYCVASLPKTEEPMAPAHFCYECRRILTEPDRNGYVIADMYNPEAVEVYTVWDGAKYEIRDYLVTVNRTDSGALEIEVHGLLDEHTSQNQ
ncbi:MAG: hypothetical protein IJW77_03345 [Clostridia bacterium]|nr:hypothetical protein [Clostridia bacterium]